MVIFFAKPLDLSLEDRAFRKREFHFHEGPWTVYNPMYVPARDINFHVTTKLSWSGSRNSDDWERVPSISATLSDLDKSLIIHTPQWGFIAVVKVLCVIPKVYGGYYNV
jgi:hypothetical protein